MWPPPDESEWERDLHISGARERDVRPSYLCGCGTSHSSRDHGIIPNSARNRGKKIQREQIQKIALVFSVMKCGARAVSYRSHQAKTTCAKSRVMPHRQTPPVNRPLEREGNTSHGPCGATAIFCRSCRSYKSGINMPPEFHMSGRQNISDRSDRSHT